MSKAFVKESEDDDEGLDDREGGDAQALPISSKNYMTPAGYRAMKEALLQLLNHERPEIVRVVTWAASNGDRSENGDYLYGKRRLREIDRRIRYLTRRLDRAEVVSPGLQVGNDQVFFGARIEFLRNGTVPEEITIVGIDEVDPVRRRVSWVSPIAKAVIKSRVGDLLSLRTPQGLDELEILSVDYAWFAKEHAEDR
jgi:transcription elongation factor GreB